MCKQQQEREHLAMYLISFFKPLKLLEATAVGCPHSAVVSWDALMSLVSAEWLIYSIQILCDGDSVLWGGTA